MVYKSYRMQVEEHVIFLQAQGFAINELKVDAGFVRVSEVSLKRARGELAYKTMRKKLANGLTGLQTWFRRPGGVTDRFLTYGLGPCNEEVIHTEANRTTGVEGRKYAEHEAIARKAYGFWNYSNVQGRSEYLIRKGAGYYGIRFRSDEKYGDVAVVPMFDENGRIWSYQLLNSNGSKRQPKGSRVEGLFHMIGKALDEAPIGMAESYVTAVSCFELTGIPTACVFSCHNLESVGIVLRKLYPTSTLVLFADNDNHLKVRGRENWGCYWARKTINTLGKDTCLIEPDFEGSNDSKDCTDWNDLIRLKGFHSAKAQIQQKLRQRIAHKKMKTSQ